MGNAAEKLDDNGREKVQCRICNNWYHRLDVHLPAKHGMNTKEYIVQYPGAPTISETARDIASKGQKKGLVKKKKATVDDDLFKLGVARLVRRTGLSEEDKALIPVHDEKWVLGKQEQETLEDLALGMEDGDNILIVGPPGIGKSTIVQELATMVDQPLSRVSFNGEMRLTDLIGSGSLDVDERTGQSVTSWKDGPLPMAAEKGHWLLIDEIDAGPAHVMFTMHSVLEENRSLTIMGDSGRRVKFSKNFRCIATANTLGHGDDTGLYAGTAPMNEALLDRFQIVIRMEYPGVSDEVKILIQKTGIAESSANKIVRVANLIREAYKNEECLVALSPRRCIAWAKKSVRLGDVARAMNLTVLNKLGVEDGKAAKDLAQRVFGKNGGFA